MLCWRNLRFSSNMPKIHGIEDHLLDQIIKYDGIGYFIEDFIEQVHEYEMLEERKLANMRNRNKATNNHSKIGMIRSNGKVINKIFEVKRKTRRVQKKRRSIDATTIIKQKSRETYYEDPIENSETMMNDYDLYPRIKQLDELYIIKRVDPCIGLMELNRDSLTYILMSPVIVSLSIYLDNELSSLT